MGLKGENLERVGDLFGVDARVVGISIYAIDFFKHNISLIKHTVFINKYHF